MHLLAKPRGQSRPKVPHRFPKSQLDRFPRRPEFARKQVGVGSVQPRPAALLYQRNEIFMDILLDRLQPLYVLGLLRKERIEHRLLVAGGIEPPLDAALLHQPVKAERGADHTNRADDREFVTDD